MLCYVYALNPLVSSHMFITTDNEFVFVFCVFVSRTILKVMHKFWLTFLEEYDATSNKRLYSGLDPAYHADPGKF